MIIGENMPDKDDPKYQNGMRVKWQQVARLLDC